MSVRDCNRKCAKCGKTRADDMTVSYHRFPNPGITNKTKASAWAKYCYPNEDWSSIEFLQSLYRKNKVLCGRHFHSSKFYDNKRQKLSKFAVPDSEEVEELLNDSENIFTQSAESAIVAGPSQPLASVENLMSHQTTRMQHKITATQQAFVAADTSKDSCVEQYVYPTKLAGPSQQLSLVENLDLTTKYDILPTTTGPTSVDMESEQSAESAIVAGPSQPLASVKNLMSHQTARMQHKITETQQAFVTADTSKDSCVEQYVYPTKLAGPSQQLSLVENLDRTTKYDILHTTTGPTSVDMESEQNNIARKKKRSILKQLNVAKKNELTPRELKLYNICQKKMKNVNRLRKQLKGKKINVIEKLIKDENVQELYNLKMTNSFVTLLQSQLQNCPKKPNGRRYSIDQKLMALVIYKKSPACYRLLRRMFALPGQSCLNKLLNGVPLKPGINTHIFESLKKMAEGNTKEENICLLLFDEMSIRKHLHYDSKQDMVLGYQDHGNHGRSQEIASKALVFMLAGLRKKWKQPVAFYFTHALTADRMTVILKEILTECIKANVDVVGTICDLSTVNIRSLKTLGATTREPYFQYMDREYVTILDPPHLLKCTRNLLLKHDLECTTDIQSDNIPVKGFAKWSYIEAFYNLDKNNAHFVYAPALTDQHIHPNVKQQMRVKLAAQVFSHSVAAGILSKIASNDLPMEAQATATFLKKIDELFDAVNADSPDLRRGKKYSTNLTAHSPHIELFNNMKKFIFDMKYIGARGKPPSQDGWIQTLNAIERLWKNVRNKNINSIATRRLNQDALENCFGCIRFSCGSNVNPTIQQFVAGIKTAIITNLRHTGRKKNCEDDYSILNNNLKTFLINNLEKQQEPSNQLADNSCTDSSIEFEELEKVLSDAAETIEEASPESQACTYVSGFIFKKIRHNGCQDCRMAFLSDEQEAIHIFTNFKEFNENNSLNYVNRNIVTSVEQCACIINNYLKSHAHEPQMKKNILALLENVDFTFLKKCKAHLQQNITHVKISAFAICIKRYIILKNRDMEEDEKKKALERKMKILKNK